MRILCSLLLLLLPLAASAAVRDFAIKWMQPLTTVDGDELEAVDGFRLFTSDGVFVQAFGGDVREAVVRINRPWGQTCFRMRSFIVVDGVEYESADSNVGACQTIKPGAPVAPKVP